MSRAHTCDVPGCNAAHERWQRLCNRCWRALPGDIRTGLTAAWRAGRKADWRTERRRAGSHMAEQLTHQQSKPTTVSPEHAYELHQRLLGER